VDDGNDAERRTDDHADEAWKYLARIREELIGCGAADGFVVGDLLLPAMSAETMRSPGGRALVGLLTALDKPRAPGRSFSAVPFLVCTLEHQTTGVRVALLGAAVSA
jgi:hypothetical protein